MLAKSFVSLDYQFVRELHERHTAWQLLRLDHAPLIISFLGRVYVEARRRVLPAAEFISVLEDELYLLRERYGASLYTQDAATYLSYWISKGLLRKRWSVVGDDAEVDLTPQTEGAIQWVASLQERSFIGTESRLLTFVEVIRQIAEETDPNAQRRLESLRAQREELDRKIARAERGDFDVLSDSAVRDRFQQATQLAHGLLADFREVEENFRKLSRSARERIALWDGSKGALLDDLWQADAAIRDSDQGRSFEAFSAFLLSIRNRNELGEHLASVLKLPALRDEARTSRLDRMHSDWVVAAEAVHGTMATLSQQLRRFLDDRALLENRRIMEILHSIEAHALFMRLSPPRDTIASIEDMKCAVELPMDRRLYRPPVRIVLEDAQPQRGEAEDDASALYKLSIVDRAELFEHIAATLEEHGEVTLRELTELRPLSHGLAELITYLDLGSSRFELDRLHFLKDTISWQRQTGDLEVERQVTMQRILFKEKSV